MWFSAGREVRTLQQRKKNVVLNVDRFSSTIPELPLLTTQLEHPAAVVLDSRTPASGWGFRQVSPFVEESRVRHKPPRPHSDASFRCHRIQR